MSSVNKKKKIDLVDDGQILIEDEDLQNLSRDELKEIIQFLDADNDVENYSKVKQAIESKVVPDIEKAKLGHRVWSYFYDKYIVRIIIVLWAALCFSVIAKAYPGFLILKNGKEISYSNIILGIGTAIIILIWHFVLAYLESKYHKKYPGSSFRRSKIGLRIVTKDGKALGISKSFLRGLFKGMPLSWITLMFMEADKNERGLHDKLFSTYVVRINNLQVTDEDIVRFIANNY